MNELNVVLINRALPYNCVGRLTGRSGVEYGQSVYEEAHGAHVCRLSLAQWRACKEDVTYGMMRRWSQWEVDVEEEAEAEIGVGRSEIGEMVEGMEDGKGQMEKGAEEEMENGQLKMEEERDAAAEVGGAREVFTAERLGRIGSFRKLLGIANRMGVVEADRLNSTEALRAAILARVGEGSAV